MTQQPPLPEVVTFGEIIMRLSPPGKQKLRQVDRMNFYFGGTELNVAASLAILGLRTRHVSAVPDNFVGDAAIASVRHHGVDPRYVQRVDHPIGQYILEEGSSIRPGRIAYNRLQGSFANISTDEIPWEEILRGCSHFHWTGITPGISQQAFQALDDALSVARMRDICVSADPAYRKNLWKYGRKGRAVLRELLQKSTLFLGGVNEINELLETDYKHTNDGFRAASKALIHQFGSITDVFHKIRMGGNASRQSIAGQAWIDGQFVDTPQIDIHPVIDRIGTGDAFAAGLIYGLHHFSKKEALRFAQAACALKHTLRGDANLASAEEIQQIAGGELSGKIKR